jgi:DNA-binding XRE family transcriptional regulator
MDFASKMRMMRAARGMTQRELAERADVSEYTIPWIENGRLLPSPEIEARIKAALDWPANADEAFAILGGNGSPAPQPEAA